MLQAQVNQSILKGGQKLPTKRLQEVLDACAKFLGVRQEQTVSIGFVSSAQMRKLNRAWRGKDKVTDVLSFELDVGLLPGGAGSGLQAGKGEILLCYEQAAIQAKQMKHSIRDELCFLIVHGVLHLWGYDHEDLKDAKTMFLLQEKILKHLKINPRVSVVSNVEL